MITADTEYKAIITDCLENGGTRYDSLRDVGTMSIPTATFKIPIEQGKLPMLTCKKIHFKSVLVELLWFLRGEDNIDFLRLHDVKIWDKDAEAFAKIIAEEPSLYPTDISDTYVGQTYGVQWKKWLGGWDQIEFLILKLKVMPLSRRHIVTAWNPIEISETALPPCHWAFEIITYPIGDQVGFTLKWHQRSVDAFLGLPFNITSYAILGKLIEQATGLVFKELVGDLSNVHIYAPHMKVAKALLKTPCYPSPSFNIDSLDMLCKEDLRPEKFRLTNYKSSPVLKAEMLAPKH